MAFVEGIKAQEATRMALRSDWTDGLTSRDTRALSLFTLWVPWGAGGQLQARK